MLCNILLTLKILLLHCSSHAQGLGMGLCASDGGWFPCALEVASSPGKMI